jgi:hypothetical protein
MEGKTSPLSSISESLAKQQKQNQQETKPKPSQIKPKQLYHRFISEKITTISSFQSEREIVH